MSVAADQVKLVQKNSGDLSWALRYRLNYHKEFLIQGNKDDNALALEVLNDILDVKATQETIKIAVEALQAKLTKNTNNVAATCLLAICYEEGLGVNKNIEQAQELHTQAAEANYAPSLNRLGVIYEQHPNRDKQKLDDVYLTSAIAQYKAAAALKYIPAIHNLARLYTDPHINFEHKIQQEGLELLHEAARAGYALSQDCLARHYDAGFHLDKNPELAQYFFTLAATQGDPDSECHMGDFCMEGVTCKKDPKKAMEWYILAADKGNLDAQIRLVDCYTRGEVVEKDLKKADHYQQLINKNPDNTAGRTYYLAGNVNLTPEAFQALLPHAVLPQPSVFSQLAAQADNEPVESWEDYVKKRGRSPYRNDPTMRRIQNNQSQVPAPVHFTYKVCKSIVGAIGTVVGYAVKPCIDKCNRKNHQP